MNKFDKFIRKHAMIHEMSLGELYKDIYKLTGISAASLVHWKKGRRTPQIKKIWALAQYFDVTSDTMLDLLNLHKG